jgi:hypothetical protein
LLRLLIIDYKINHHHHRNDNEDDHNNEEAPPLLVVASARADNCGDHFLVTLCDGFADLLALGCDVGNERLLLLHNLVEVLEKLGELDHLALNFLGGLVALPHAALGRARLDAAVRVEELRSRS